MCIPVADRQVRLARPPGRDAAWTRAAVSPLIERLLLAVGERSSGLGGGSLQPREYDYPISLLLTAQSGQRGPATGIGVEEQRQSELAGPITASAVADSPASLVLSDTGSEAGQYRPRHGDRIRASVVAGRPSSQVVAPVLHYASGQGTHTARTPQRQRRDHARARFGRELRRDAPRGARWRTDPRPATTTRGARRSCRGVPERSADRCREPPSRPGPHREPGPSAACLTPPRASV